MSSAATPPTVARPSVFISYASEDRAAARALRDTLAQAGLEVWYDENELGGGDAWDQKIRRQIRECDYFMPLISASTERRKEGYFRREWRLAAERTMDMADDVLFLLPVVIDHTSEAGARVPDKFVSVQWLRAPGAETTAALTALIQRLLRGEHAAPSRPPLVARPSTAAPLPPIAGPASAPPPPPSPHGAHAAHAAPPPMPHFPHSPERGGVGQWLKFFAEVIWWIVTAAWMVIVRLPKWLRFVLAVWVVFTVLGTCRSTSNNAKPRGKDAAEQAPARPTPPRRGEDKTGEEIGAAIEKVFKEGGVADVVKMGEEMARRYNKKGGTSVSLAGKPLVLIPIVVDRSDADTAKFEQTVFSQAYGKLIIARQGEVAMSPSLPAVNTDKAWADIGKSLDVALVLGFRVQKIEQGAAQLSVRLLRSSDASVVWSAEFPAVIVDAPGIADKIVENVVPALPKKE